MLVEYVLNVLRTSSGADVERVAERGREIEREPTVCIGSDH